MDVGRPPRAVIKSDYRRSLNYNHRRNVTCLVEEESFAAIKLLSFSPSPLPMLFLHLFSRVRVTRGYELSHNNAARTI